MLRASFPPHSPSPKTLEEVFECSSSDMRVPRKEGAEQPTLFMSKFRLLPLVLFCAFPALFICILPKKSAGYWDRCIYACHDGSLPKRIVIRRQ